MRHRVQYEYVQYFFRRVLRFLLQLHFRFCTQNNRSKKAFEVQTIFYFSADVVCHFGTNDKNFLTFFKIQSKQPSGKECGVSIYTAILYYNMTRAVKTSPARGNGAVDTFR